MQDNKDFESYWREAFNDSENINKDGFFITLPNEEIITKTYVIDKTAAENIFKISKNNSVAEYVILVSAIGYILGRYSNSRKVSVGTADFSDKNGLSPNGILPLVLEKDENLTLKEWIEYIKKSVLEVQKYNNLNIAEYMDKMGLVKEQYVKTSVSLEEEGNFNTKIKSAENLFKFYKADSALKLDASFAKSKENEMNHLIKNISVYFEALSKHINEKLIDINFISEEEIKYIESFNNTDRDYDFSNNYYELFKEQCIKTPENIAVVENEESITYRELDKKASQISEYLIKKADLKPSDYAAILFPNSIDQIIVTMAVVKTGAAFIPLDTDLPKERIKYIVNNSKAKVIIFPKNKIKLAQDILWECESIKRAFCADSFCAENEKEEETNTYMDKSLWEYVGDNAQDDIALGGWSSSYTGENFSVEEMDEYSQNAYKKLSSILSGKEKVLEIGCGSGLTMFPLSVHAKEYCAVDLSESTVKKDIDKAEKEGLNNIKIECYAAHDVKKINENGFDLVIMNSVIQCFNGHNYLKNVIRDAVSMMNDKGKIFIGDIMNLDTKAEFEKSLKDYKKANPTANTKTDLSEELFLGKDFFENLPFIIDGVTAVEFSPKIYTIPNELTLYRYDVFITVDKRAENKKGTQYKFLDCLKDTKEFENSSDILPQKHSLDDTAVVIYTSGTTGNPKGVELSCKSILNLCFYSEEVFEITENDRRAKNATFSFDASLWETFPFLLKGASVYIVDPSIKLNLSAVNKFFEDNKITIAFFTTQVAEQFMKLKNTSLRYLIAGGEKLRRFYPNSPYKMMNVYGPTETTVVATNYIVEEDMENIPIGKPFPTVKCYIVDSMERIQPLGARGEIYISGDGVGKGYINKPEMTKERFSEYKGRRVYKTGDYAYYGSDGNILFFGRRDKQLKINGFRIEVGEIEKHILDLEFIKEAVVIDYADKEGNKYMCCYYVAPKEFTADDFSAFLSQNLPYYMIPAYFVRLEKIPYTINGKVLRRDLPDPKKASDGKEHTKPENKKETEILNIWKNVLGTDDIGTKDDFFKIGGNSIKGIKVVSAMSENFKVDINQIFNYTTVKALAENVEYAEGHFKKIRDEVIKDQTTGINENDKKIIEEKYKNYVSSIEENKKVIYNPDKYKNVLLLGATGFLGVHILCELIKNTKADITVILRGKNNKDSVERLYRTINYYFGDINEAELSRIRILTGEITKPYFGLSEEEYINLADTTDAVINSAANVHHYGDYSEFYGINTELVSKLVDFASIGRKKDIHHTSTVGIAAGYVEGRKDLIFTEDDFDVNQSIDNVYADTKFLGEKIIYEARKNGITANIYRMGNLTGRASDGHFQKNMGENGFYKIMRSMITMGIMPDVKEETIDFTYIDNAAEAVVRLAFSQGTENGTYHVQNTNNISIHTMAEYFSQMGLNIKLKEYGDYLKFIFDNHNNPEYADDIETILLHMHFEENVKLSRFKIICLKTQNVLKKCGFQWSLPTKERLEKLLKFSIDEGFFEGKNIN